MVGADHADSYPQYGNGEALWPLSGVDCSGYAFTRITLVDLFIRRKRRAKVQVGCQLGGHYNKAKDDSSLDEGSSNGGGEK